MSNAVTDCDPIRGEIIESVVSGLDRRFPHVHLHVVIDLGRDFDREHLVAAARETIAAFPVLGCRYRRRWWRDRWIPWEGDVGDLVHANEEDDVDRTTRSWVERGFEIQSEPPFRLARFGHGGVARLIVSLNHMVADGAGALAVANVLASRLYGVEPMAAVGNRRHLTQVLGGVRLRDLPILIGELFREALRPLLILRVERLTRPLPRADGGPRPHWSSVELTGEPAARFAARCRERGATINDGLVGALARVAVSRSRRGPVAVGYTADLRRFLPEPRCLATNLAGVLLAVLPREQLDDPGSAFEAASRVTGAQKRRLLGIGNALLPGFAFGWLPHGPRRWFGRWVINRLLSYFGRALVLTNIGPMDRALAPFGDDVLQASIVGPFVHGAETPVVTATGFRGALTLNVCASGNLEQGGVAAYSREILAALDPDPG
jgi:NRPS condensation-like uncharacterized protein